jgi:hypothetical protein
MLEIPLRKANAFFVRVKYVFSYKPFKAHCAAGICGNGHNNMIFNCF